MWIILNKTIFYNKLMDNSLFSLFGWYHSLDVLWPCKSNILQLKLPPFLVASDRKKKTSTFLQMCLESAGLKDVGVSQRIFVSIDFSKLRRNTDYGCWTFSQLLILLSLGSTKYFQFKQSTGVFVGVIIYQQAVEKAHPILKCMQFLI